MEMIKNIAMPNLRLGRRTVRKGYAFPSKATEIFGEAMPRQEIRGAASRLKRILSERRSLSALCGGEAAFVERAATFR